MKSLRWRMMALLMIGSIINYLTRSTLGVAAPTILQDLHITAQQYSLIVGTFQGAIMLQPICGYVLDVVGLKAGFAMFAITWSFVSMAHSLAHSWPALAVLRGMLGFAEGCANPAGMKATAEWFPAKERGLAGGAEWTWIPQQFDASILSDEATAPGLPNFTGAFVGMACQDMSGARCHADFDWFEYVERPYRVDPFGT
jgi:MFS family permease